MARNKHRTIGKGYKTVTCAQTGEEVSRRKSLAIDYPGDGRQKGPAAPSKRVIRKLAKAPERLVVPKATKVPIVKAKEIISQNVAAPALTSREKAHMADILRSKRNEDPKST